MDTSPEATDNLPDDPEALLALLEAADPAEAPELVARLAAALEAALADADTP